MFIALSITFSGILAVPLFGMKTWWGAIEYAISKLE